MQSDDGSMTRIEAPKRRVHELTLGEHAGVIGNVHRVDRGEFDLDRAPPTATKEIEAGIDHQPVQPGVEAIRVTEPRQIAPGADEALLDRILCQVRVTEDQSGGCVQSPEGAIDELGKGVMIASLRPFDTLSLIHDRLACGTAVNGRTQQGMASVFPEWFIQAQAIRACRRTL